MGLCDPRSARKPKGCKVRFLLRERDVAFFTSKPPTTVHTFPQHKRWKKTSEIGWVIPPNVSAVSAKYMETQTNTLTEPEYTPRASPRHPYTQKMKGRVCWTILRHTPKPTTAYNTIIIILIGFPFRGRDHNVHWPAKSWGKSLRGKMVREKIPPIIQQQVISKLPAYFVPIAHN